MRDNPPLTTTTAISSTGGNGTLQQKVSPVTWPETSKSDVWWPEKGEAWMSSTEPGKGLRMLYGVGPLVLFDRIPGPGWSGMTLPGFRKWVRVHNAIKVIT